MQQTLSSTDTGQTVTHAAVALRSQCRIDDFCDSGLGAMSLFDVDCLRSYQSAEVKIAYGPQYDMSVGASDRIGSNISNVLGVP